MKWKFDRVVAVNIRRLTIERCYNAQNVSCNVDNISASYCTTVRIEQNMMPIDDDRVYDTKRKKKKKKKRSERWRPKQWRIVRTSIINVIFCVEWCNFVTNSLSPISGWTRTTEESGFERIQLVFVARMFSLILSISTSSNVQSTWYIRTSFSFTLSLSSVLFTGHLFLFRKLSRWAISVLRTGCGPVEQIFFRDARRSRGDRKRKRRRL